MYLSTSEAIYLIICAGIMGIMLIMLFLANHTLLTKNRFLKETIRNKNKYCAQHHAEVPF